MGWFSLAVLSFVAFGAQNYLYKVSAMRDLNTRAVTLAYILLSTGALWIAVVCSPATKVPSDWIVFLAVLDAVCYYTTTISRIEALRYLPTSIAFPITRMSTIVVVVCAVAIFDEPLSWQLGCALVLVFLVLFVIQSERSTDIAQWPRYAFGIGLSLLAMISSAGTNIISKIAAATGSYSVYMATANTIIIGLCAGDMAIRRDMRASDWTREVAGIGALIAVTNLVAWYAYLEALSTGPLGTVATISSLAFVVPIILSAAFHEESLSARRATALLLTCIALGLLHLGSE